MNPITIYMLDNLVDIGRISKRFAGGDLNAYFGRSGTLVLAIVGMGITLAIARFLYRRKIFLRV